MSRWEGVSPWILTVSTHLPRLSPPQARVLALWSYGAVLAQNAGLTTVAALLGEVLGQRENTVRQRLREWCYEAADKRGRQRRAVEVEACFASLLGWVLAWWPAAERRLALALDATTLGERFTVLTLSVVVQGCAIPVAWAVGCANAPGAWRPHWERLLRQVSGVVPDDWLVVVLADRGLYARWLYRAIQDNGWHPFLRINAGGTCHPAAGGGQRPLGSVVPTAGSPAWCGEVVCFLGRERQLACTLLACWTPGHQERWLVLTDLPPQAAQVAWYGLRAWTRAGFQDLKRGGWQWHQTKMTDPARASRFWLVLAVATLWTVSVGSAAEAATAHPTLPAAASTRRRLSGFRRGRLVVLAAALQGWSRPLGNFAPQPWPSDQPAPPRLLPARDQPPDVETYP